jgi:DNA-binding NarL/FixJ family response regulator
MPTTIFLADSALIFCEALQLLLETQPTFKVIGSTGDGWTAVREIDLLSPDIAILDIYMPG